jgi:hypothetical protein
MRGGPVVCQPKHHAHPALHVLKFHQTVRRSADRLPAHLRTTSALDAGNSPHLHHGLPETNMGHLEKFALPTAAQIRFKLLDSERGMLAWDSLAFSI